MANQPLPTVEQWCQRIPLTRQGKQWVGACPLCGGADRWHMRPGRAAPAIGCRGCLDGLPPAARAAQFGAMLQAVFPERQESQARAPVRRQKHATRRRWEAARVARAEAQAPGQGIEHALWGATSGATGTPGHVYLLRRWCWPPAIVRRVPEAVGWLSAEAASEIPIDKERRWYGLPKGAAGALCFVYRRIGAMRVLGVSLEALDAEGERLSPERWRRTFGQRKGAIFGMRGNPQASVVAVCEGEVDALALLLTGAFAEVRCTGGTSGFTLAACADARRRHVVLVPDADPPGAKAALRLATELAKRGRSYQIATPGAGGKDAAESIGQWLAAKIQAIEVKRKRESDRTTARADAWGLALAELGKAPLLQAL